MSVPTTAPHEEPPLLAEDAVTSSFAGKARATGTLLFVCTLFVLSGACGLAYEVVWSKYLGLFLGNTVLVHTTILGTFMGGMALGSLITGTRVERVTAPLKMYAYMELAVAGYALAFPTLARFGQDAVAQAAATFGPASTGLLLFRVFMGVLLLVVPTLLMGATLPLLTAHVERAVPLLHTTERRERGGDGANWLYFANCAGAVLGTLVTGFLLIPQLGLTATVTGVAILNVLVGLAAAMAGSPSDESTVTVPGNTLDTVKDDSPTYLTTQQARQTSVVLLGICASGATAFLYELVWTRLFAVSLGSSTYSFTLMLAAFISGLCLGSIAANVLPVRRAPLAWFAAAEIGIGIAIALSLSLYPRIPYWNWQWRWILHPAVESIGIYRLCQYGLIFAIMAVPTMLFGLTFPAAIRAAAQFAEGDHARGKGGASVAVWAARVYGWNTTGTLIGATVAGAILIPVFGLQRTLQIGAALNLLIGAGLLWTVLPRLRSRTGTTAAALAPFVAPVSAATALLVFFLPAWPAATFRMGHTRGNRPAPPTYALYRANLDRMRPLFYREDFGTTVAVVEADDEGAPDKKQITLIVDGKADASSFSDMPTQKMLGHLPLLFKPAAQQVFVLGLGSGASAAAVLKHPDVAKVDCAELSQAVVEASRFFEASAGAPRRDPRFHLYVEDGRTFLQSVPAHQYDVIVSEPTNPWIAGVGGLFSEESFRNMERALKEDGVLAQWVQSYHLDDALFATIVRTCRRVFPHVLIFQGASRMDHVLIASKQPLSTDFARMEQEFSRPTVRADISTIGLPSLLCILSTQTHTSDAVIPLEENGGINSDDLPILEYKAPDALYLGSTAERIRDTDCRLFSAPDLLLRRYLQSRPPTREAHMTLIQTYTDPLVGHEELLRRALLNHVERWPTDRTALRMLGEEYNRRGQLMAALPFLDRAARLGEKQAAALAGQIRQGVQDDLKQSLLF